MLCRVEGVVCKAASGELLEKSKVSQEVSHVGVSCSLVGEENIVKEASYVNPEEAKADRGQSRVKQEIEDHLRALIEEVLGLTSGDGSGSRWGIGSNLSRSPVTRRVSKDYPRVLFAVAEEVFQLQGVGDIQRRRNIELAEEATNEGA